VTKSHHDVTVSDGDLGMRVRVRVRVRVTAMETLG